MLSTGPRSSALPVSVRPASLLALCAATMLAAFAMLSIPAYAHDTLISSDPADGDTLETSPESITLTYSADILEVSPAVRIVDEAGETIADVEPTVDGPDVTAELADPLPAGDYTVQWRVVSSDGHPIEGSVDITVEQDAADQDAAAASDGGGESAAAGASDAGGADEVAAGSSGSSDAGGSSDATGTESGEESGDTASESTEESGSSMPLLLGVVGIVVVGAAVAAFFALRTRS
ncbi:copper resistance CopC family protein [Brachybacterium tyrofermentans]|uniref:copper resistance CopC family protein n=1 Tax=Brachybacterium tyrofermentans TaxID=47848 RepID=UPI001868B183|nr:copper resistance CopC family protein [Brachybacterium tyrofermentans]